MNRGDAANGLYVELIVTGGIRGSQEAGSVRSTA